MTDDLIKCEVCDEWTHPRANGDKRCPKHLRGEKKKKESIKKKEE